MKMEHWTLNMEHGAWNLDLFPSGIWCRRQLRIWSQREFVASQFDPRGNSMPKGNYEFDPWREFDDFGNFFFFSRQVTRDNRQGTYSYFEVWSSLLSFCLWVRTSGRSFVPSCFFPAAGSEATTGETWNTHFTLYYLMPSAIENLMLRNLMPSAILYFICDLVLTS